MIMISMCFTQSIIFIIFALVFAILREKSTNIINGFNLFPEEKKKKYDRLAISKDFRNQFLLWAAILMLGALLGKLIDFRIAVFQYILWIIVFIKDVHINPDKAFEKYKF